jgi:hypothetical protein
MSSQPFSTGMFEVSSSTTMAGGGSTTTQSTRVLSTPVSLSLVYIHPPSRSFSTLPITFHVFNPSAEDPSSSAVTLTAIQAQQLLLQEMYRQYERENRLANAAPVLNSKAIRGRVLLLKPRSTWPTPPFRGQNRPGRRPDKVVPPVGPSVTLQVYPPDCSGSIPS